jgi:hypothetical protein
LKGHDSARPHQPGRRSQDSHRIRKELKNVAADDGIEGPIAGDLRDITFREAHIVQAGVRRAGLRAVDRMRVSLYAKHFSGGPDQTRGKHCNISDTRPEVQHVLARTNARLAKELFCDRRETHGLSNETGVLCIGVAK